MVPKSLISIKNLNVTYFAGRSNQVQALKNITLDIFAGQFIIFFGPSGCGKSTLLYSIAGLERNVEGTVIVKEKNLATMKKEELEEYHQRVIGMIFQSFYLIPSLTVLENVALPQVAMSIDEPTRRKQANDLLKKFGVAEQADKLPTELSGGQQQRVAICRSVVNNPDILVADEPVGNLDSTSSEDVMNLLRSLNDEQRKTVILVTHDPSHLRHAHRIFFLKDGEITGTKDNTEAERQRPVLTPEKSSTGISLGQWIRPSSSHAKLGHQDGQYIEKAQQILAEILTGLTVEELTEFEEKVLHCIREKKTDKDDIVEYLHRSPKEGGIGMNKLKAKRVALEIAAIVEHMINQENNDAETKKDPKAPPEVMVSPEKEHEIRRYILDTLDIRLRELSVVPIIDTIVLKRLKGFIGRMDVQKLLNQPAEEGGVGMDIRVARKFSRKLEALSPNFPDIHANS